MNRVIAIAATLMSASPAAAQIATTADPAAIDHFTNPNIAMPNGANIAHTIYQSRPTSPLTLSGTAAQSVFSVPGDGSLTIPSAAMFVGARFHAYFGGRGQTGLANISTVTGCLKLGATSLVCGTTLALPASVSAIPFGAETVCTVRSVGASGSMTCKGLLWYASGLASGAQLTTDLTTTSAVSINTTVPQAWDATIQLSSLIGTPSLTIYDAYIIQEN